MPGVYEYIISMTDKFSPAMQKISGSVDNAMGKVNGFTEKAWKFNQVSELFDRSAQSLQNMAAPGLQFEQGMADLSAITGIAGDDLEGLGSTARKMGKATGVGAANAVEAYKLLASQIDVSKIGMAGLNELQSKTITLAQASGLGMGDAANALAGTINQFGLEASEAGRIINVLAAGAKYGAAEIPDLAQSFKVVGASANAAGVSVESTAGALETLSKMNLKGAEAGTAFRNVLLKMQTELGVDFRVTKLSDALAGLAPKMQDAAYMSKIFGVENMAAAQFLAGNAGLVEEMTNRVNGTNVAYEQATIRTDTVSHKMEVLGAWFKDVGISVFNATKPFLSYAAAMAQTMSGVMQAIPIISGFKGLLGGMASSLWAVEMAEDGVTVASKKFVLWEYAKSAALKISAGAQWLYNGAAAIGGGVMAWLKGRVDAVRNAMATGSLGTLMFSGAMGVATGVAGAFSIALKAVGKAFYSIPIIGWIAAAIAAIVALFALLWNKSEWFRGLMGGLWGSVKTIFHNIGVFFGMVWDNLIKTVFVAIGDVIGWIKDSVFAPLGSFFASIWNGIAGGVQWLGERFSGVWSWITGVLDSVGLKFTSFWGFVGSLFKLGAKILFWPFTLLMKLFPDLGAWLEQKVWEPIKAVFERIAAKIGKLIEPIKKIWGKLFKNEEYSDVSKGYIAGSEKERDKFRKEQEAKNKTDNQADVTDLMAGLEGNAPAISLNPTVYADTSKGKAQKSGKDDIPALGVPQDYNQTNAYSVIASKFGNSTDLAAKPANPTEKPVINMATRVEEIAGSLRKIAAITALPVVMGLGATNIAKAETLMPATNLQHNVNATEENNLFANITNSATNYSSSASLLTDDNSRNYTTNNTKNETINNQGKTVHFDRFTDKIEIHVSGVDSPRLAADQVRNEVEKALAEILNV